jgi:hypothetical protein
MIPRSSAQAAAAANGVFTLTLNAALRTRVRASRARMVINIAGPQAVITVVRPVLPGGSLLLHAAASHRLPSREPEAPRVGRRARPMHCDRRAAARRVSAIIRGNRSITGRCIYLGITASLVACLGVLGPASPRRASASAEGLRGHRPAARRRHRDGDLLLNAYGKYPAAPTGDRGGRIVLGVMLLAASRWPGRSAAFLQRATRQRTCSTCRP